MLALASLFLSLSRTLALWSMRLGPQAFNLASPVPCAHVLNRHDFTIVIWREGRSSQPLPLVRPPMSSATPLTWWSRLSRRWRT